METPTRTLRDEHQLILRVVDAFEATISSIASGHGTDIELETVSNSIAFFRLFIDACHHGKEEDLLFPELEAGGLPHDGGPIAVMLMEHEHGRRVVRSMTEALASVRNGDTDSLNRLVRRGREYVSFIRAHIDKEDGVLFHIADGMVPAARCERLCAAYVEADACAFESRSKAELETLAARILNGTD